MRMPVPTESRTRVKNRAVTVASTISAAAVVYLIGRALAGALTVPQTGGRPDMEVTLPMVLFVSSVAGLLGWGSAALLERVTTRGTRIWSGIAVVVLLASFIPLAMPGIGAGSRVVLSLLHLVVGLMLIRGINHTSPHHADAVPEDQPSGGAPAKRP